MRGYAVDHHQLRANSHLVLAARRRGWSRSSSERSEKMKSGGLVTIIMLAVGAYVLYQIASPYLQATANLPVPAGDVALPGNSFLVGNATPIVPDF